MKLKIFISLSIIMLILTITCCNSNYEKTGRVKAEQQTITNQKFEKFIHPTKVFSIEYPKEWGPPEQFEYNKNVYMFNTSSSYPSLTISITENLNLPEEMPLESIKYMFPDEKFVGEPIREKTKDWNSLYQLVEGGENNNTVWYVTHIGYMSNAIAITLSAPKIEIEKYSEIYKKIVKSIKFNKIE